MSHSRVPRICSMNKSMKDEVSRSNKAVDKMRDETVRLRSRVNELHDEKSDLQKQHESHIADEESAARERETVITDLRSVLDLRNQQLNVMEQSVGTITEDRTRIQLLSTEATMTIVSLRRELEEARAAALTTRASEEAARLQISRMMDEQLSQNQTIDSLRRQVESSNSHGCHRPTIIPVEQEVSLVTLLSYRQLQPLRQDFVLSRCWDMSLLQRRQHPAIPSRLIGRLIGM